MRHTARRVASTHCAHLYLPTLAGGGGGVLWRVPPYHAAVDSQVESPTGIQPSVWPIAANNWMGYQTWLGSVPTLADGGVPTFDEGIPALALGGGGKEYLPWRIGGGTYPG